MEEEGRESAEDPSPSLIQTMPCNAITRSGEEERIGMRMGMGKEGRKRIDPGPLYGVVLLPVG